MCVCAIVSSAFLTCSVFLSLCVSVLSLVRFNKPRPESTPLPLEWRKLDDQAPFMKLLVVRAMRPDRMTIAMENYVKEALPSGPAYIECDAGKSFMDVLTASLDDSTTVSL